MEMNTIAKREKINGGKRGVTYNLLPRVVLTFVSVIIAVVFIRPALSEHYSDNLSLFDKNKLVRAARITSENAGYQYLLGLLYYSSHDRSGIDKAREHYLLSLKSNPTDGLTWLALAKAYRDNGSRKDADYALGKALHLDKDNRDVIWESALFFLLDQKQKQALPLFRRYIQMVPEEQANVYTLCYMLRVEPMSILNDLVPDDYSFYRTYFSFLLGNKLFDETIEVWKRMNRFNPERGEYLEYSNFLIASGEMKKALALWDDFAKRFYDIKNKPSGEMLWNGDFELPIENGGFDWKIGKSDGVRVYRDKDIKWTGFASLSVMFDGNINPEIIIAQQVVPVDPGQRYTLTGYIRTEKITTQNGIVLEASNYSCDSFSRKTEPVIGTTLWKRVDLEFTTPRQCKAVTIAVKRERSEKFDNKISGDAWIDSLSMTQTKTK
jgi:tetratricopeptide (TPR) repeat protein